MVPNASAGMMHAKNMKRMHETTVEKFSLLKASVQSVR
jgi:hypothetical protein